MSQRCPTAAMDATRQVECLEDNFYLMASGTRRTPTLIDALMERGWGRIMFAANSPFEEAIEASCWCELNPSERGRREMGRQNAIRRFTPLK